MADENIEFAGDFNLPSIVLHNYKNKGRPVDGGNKRGVDIKHMVQEFNIFESMFSGAITGSMVLADATNLIGNLPIQGTERLTFKLATKGMPTIDCSDETGHPMHIYKLSDKQQAKDGMQIYVLHFCSREFLRNLRTKVSKAFSGTLDQMVNSIMTDKEFIDTRKDLFFQKTRNQDKIVIPNKRPFSAISMLCKRAMADNSKHVGYYFYETTKGFHFRSWESLCVRDNKEPRKPVQTFRYMPMNIDDPDVDDKIVHDYTSVEDYKFVNNFHDVAANTALGTYGHRVITHNLYNKSYKEDDYHYHNSFQETGHVDNNGGYGKESSYTTSNPMIVETPVDYDLVEGDTRQKGVSDFAESRVSLQATSQFVHNEETGAFGVDVAQDGVIEGERVSLTNQLHSGTRLQMTINGQAWLQAGDLIQFDVQSVENRDDRPTGPLDPQLSGRYVISHIRHRVSGEYYKQVIECIKDSVARPYGTGVKSYAEIAGTEPKPVSPSDIDYS